MGLSPPQGLLPGEALHKHQPPGEEEGGEALEEGAVHVVGHHDPGEGPLGEALGGVRPFQVQGHQGEARRARKPP